MPLISTINDPAALYERLSQRLREEMHPLTVVYIPGIPAVSRKDRRIVALLGEYPEEFMYADAYMAAIRYYLEVAQGSNVFRREAWTILYCEANLNCDGNAYRTELQTIKYHPHEFNEILQIAESVRTALHNRDPGALGL